MYFILLQECIHNLGIKFIWMVQNLQMAWLRYSLLYSVFFSSSQVCKFWFYCQCILYVSISINSSCRISVTLNGCLEVRFSHSLIFAASIRFVKLAFDYGSKYPRLLYGSKVYMIFRGGDMEAGS